MMARIIEDNVLRHPPICPICKIGVWAIGSRRTSNTDILCGYGYLKAMPLPREQRNSPKILLGILESPAGCWYPAWKPFLLTHVCFTWPLEQLLNDVSMPDRESASADTIPCPPLCYPTPFSDLAHSWVISGHKESFGGKRGQFSPFLPKYIFYSML